MNAGSYAQLLPERLLNSFRNPCSMRTGPDAQQGADSPLVRILRSLYDNPYAFKGFSSETDLATVLEMLEEWIGNITDYLHQRDCRFDEDFEDDDADSQDEE